ERQRSLAFHKQRQRSSEAVQKILLAYRPNLAVAEEAGQPDGAELLLHVSCIVIRLAKQVLAATVATAQARPVNGAACQFFARPLQQRRHVLGARRRVASLELDRLAGARKRS